jgi:hypothetical protein
VVPFFIPAERDADDEVAEPTLAPFAEHVELPMHEPAEPECGAEPDERGKLRDEAAIGCRNAAEQQNPLVESEHRENRRREHDRRDVAAQQHPHDFVERAAEAPGAIDLHDQAAHREHEHVEDGEVIEKPEVHERERARAGVGGCGRHGIAHRRIGRSPDAPDQRPDRQGREHDPADQHRAENPLRSIRDKAASTAPLEQQPREQPRDHEERRHPKRVDHEEQNAERGALRDVVRRYRQEERHRGVQHDARKQRKRAHGVECM